MRRIQLRQICERHRHTLTHLLPAGPNQPARSMRAACSPHRLTCQGAQAIQGLEPVVGHVKCLQVDKAGEGLQGRDAVELHSGVALSLSGFPTTWQPHAQSTISWHPDWQNVQLSCRRGILEQQLAGKHSSALKVVYGGKVAGCGSTHRKVELPKGGQRSKRRDDSQAPALHRHSSSQRGC